MRRESYRTDFAAAKGARPGFDLLLAGLEPDIDAAI
jgi:hypothetical protein